MGTRKGTPSFWKRDYLVTRDARRGIPAFVRSSRSLDLEGKGTQLILLGFRVLGPVMPNYPTIGYRVPGPFGYSLHATLRPDSQDEKP